MSKKKSFNSPSFRAMDNLTFKMRQLLVDTKKAFNNPDREAGEKEVWQTYAPQMETTVELLAQNAKEWLLEIKQQNKNH